MSSSPPPSLPSLSPRTPGEESTPSNSTSDPPTGTSLVISARSRPLLPCGRVDVVAPDRIALESLITSVFDRLEAQQAIVDQYKSVQEELRAQKHRGDQLESQLEDLRALASRFIPFAQSQYRGMFHRCQDALEKVDDLQEELGARLDQSAEIARLQALSQEESDAHVAVHAQLMRELVILRKAVASATATVTSLQARRNTEFKDAISKISRQKDRIARPQQSLLTSQNRFYRLQNAKDDLTTELAVRDGEVAEWRSKAADLEVERNRAIQDRDSFRDRLGHRVSETTSLPTSQNSKGSTDPSTARSVSGPKSSTPTKRGRSAGSAGSTKRARSGTRSPGSSNSTKRAKTVSRPPKPRGSVKNTRKTAPSPGLDNPATGARSARSRTGTSDPATVLPPNLSTTRSDDPAASAQSATATTDSGDPAASVPPITPKTRSRKSTKAAKSKSRKPGSSNPPALRRSGAAKKQRDY